MVERDGYLFLITTNKRPICNRAWKNRKKIDDDTYNCPSTRFSAFPIMTREMRMSATYLFSPTSCVGSHCRISKEDFLPYLTQTHTISRRTGLLAGFCISSHLGREISQQHKQTTCQNDLKNPEQLTTENVVFDANSVDASSESRRNWSNSTLNRKC